MQANKGHFLVLFTDNVIFLLCYSVAGILQTQAEDSLYT